MDKFFFYSRKRFISTLNIIARQPFKFNTKKKIYFDLLKNVCRLKNFPWWFACNESKLVFISKNFKLVAIVQVFTSKNVVPKNGLTQYDTHTHTRLYKVFLFSFSFCVCVCVWKLFWAFATKAYIFHVNSRQSKKN